ncbi:MAG: hypothetical protein F6K35_26250, partial [Okeania sp. SIO2H7]|nr:hypothetical protein [Okeania sp. SIO2H7]
TNDEGIKLQLIGSLHNFSLNVPIILGVVHGKIITICDCINSSSRISSPGFSSQEYISEFALIGRHFSKPDEILFHKGNVQYSYLSDWGELPAIKKEPDFAEDWNKERELRFIYTRPETIEAITTYGKFSVIYYWSEAGKRESINFQQFISLTIQPNEEKLSFKDICSKFIGHLNDFITFATDRTNSITKLEVYSYYGDVDVDLEKIPYTIEQLPIKALYKTNYPERKERNRLLIHGEMYSEMLFSISDIDNLSSTMERWFDSWEKLASTFNLFFSIRYKPDIYLENKFINLVHAVESYHRRLIKEEEILIERLKGLVKQTSEVTNQLIQDKDLFFTKVIDTRNYLTHYRESKKKKAAQREELSCLTELLSFILQACFLTELGFTSEQCYQLLNRNDRYQKTVEIIRNKM